MGNMICGIQADAGQGHANSRLCRGDLAGEGILAAFAIVAGAISAHTVAAQKQDG